MRIIKKKSLIVATISSIVISTVLILTIIGYLAYMELRGERLKSVYAYLSQKVNAKTYGKYLEVSNLDARIETREALRGKGLVEGIIRNNGARTVTDIIIKVKFIDKDGAVIFEAVFHPQEPSLGTSFLSGVTIPYLITTPKVTLKPNETLTFKKLLLNCPAEILKALREGSGSDITKARWRGTLSSEVLAVEF